MDYLEPLFPQVHFISNDSNLGFARANNQVLKICRGEYVLFLNPDTLVPEDCFEKCLDFLAQHDDIGGLGVQMLDGQGRFLPESKRAFPSPMVSFFKLSGLSAVFPGSSFFNRYALGHLDRKQNHEAEVLAGAFLMAPRKLLQELNGFDERFFLYGEDIDLSCRIRAAGLKNYYFAGTEIIHFKGESSAATRFDHTRFFYRAMILFIEKHYSTKTGRLFSVLLRIAVAIRSVIAFTGRLLKPMLLPVSDACMAWLSLYLIKTCWIHSVRNGMDFHVPFIAYALPMFAATFVIAAALTGLYDKWYRASKAVLSVIMGVAGMLILYSLLPERLRFSRGVVLSGGLTGGVLALLLRLILPGRFFAWLGYEPSSQSNTAVVGDRDEFSEVQQLLYHETANNDLLGRIDPGTNVNEALGPVQKLSLLQKKLGIREIIFCVGAMPLSSVIKTMAGISGRHTRFLFHFKGSQSLAGSDFPGAAGRYIGSFHQYRIADPRQLRMKRMVDIVFSLLLLLSFPIHLLVHKKAAGLLKNAATVLLGRKTWVGYLGHREVLPPLPDAVTAHTFFPGTVSQETLYRADKLYAKNYDWWQDVQVLVKRYRQLA